MSLLIKLILLFFIIIRANNLYSQDERFFRNFFGDADSKKKKEESRTLKYQYNSPVYFYDLDGDGKDEGLVLEKREAEDWLNIHNSKNDRIASFKLDHQGIDSHLYKINVRSLGQKINPTKVLILYYYEGFVGQVNIKSTSRVYFVTIDNSDLKTIAIYRGPSVWDEETKKNHYHQRIYETSLYDYNNDGVKEIAFKHQYITKIFFYLGHGQWSTI